MPRPTTRSLLLATTAFALLACKGGRGKLEQLVPDGATGIVSVDAKGMVSAGLYDTMKKGMGDNAGQVQGVLDEIRDQCEVDLEKMETYVVGFDALSQNVMGALRVSNIGKADALRCMSDLAKDKGGSELWSVGEADGKATVTIDDGEAQGWAMDDDTLVVSTKGWASAVQARMKGESKGAVDNNLAKAVALADRGKHVWFAGEIPSVAQPFLKETPAAGVVRAGGSLQYGENIELAVATAFTDEAAATAAKDEIEPLVAGFKEVAGNLGIPSEAVDSLKLEVDGEVLKAEVAFPLTPLIETTTAAFDKYIARSKTSEARVMIAKMFDGASSYFNEEQVAQDALAKMASHQCPNDGRAKGSAGVTPPLTVDCNKGDGGRCTPGSEGAGGYDAKLWADNPVWQQLNFQMDDAHYFHYDFRWENSGDGFGECQFTAQAFGDLDGDGVFSTYERSGAGDQYGVNAAAGLYIDQEVE